MPKPKNQQQKLECNICSPCLGGSHSDVYEAEKKEKRNKKTYFWCQNSLGQDEYSLLYHSYNTPTPVILLAFTSFYTKPVCTLPAHAWNLREGVPHPTHYRHGAYMSDGATADQLHSCSQLIDLCWQDWTGNTCPSTLLNLIKAASFKVMVALRLRSVTRRQFI